LAGAADRDQSADCVSSPAPFGFAIIFLRGAAPKGVKTTDIYWGVIPFILIQLSVLALAWAYPGIVAPFRS